MKIFHSNKNRITSDTKFKEIKREFFEDYREMGVKFPYNMTIEINETYSLGVGDLQFSIKHILDGKLKFLLTYHAFPKLCSIDVVIFVKPNLADTYGTR